jgi:WD repeat-containing protein 68
MATAERKGEVFSYQAPWPIYGMGWSQLRSKPFRLAVGSFIEEYTNKVGDSHPNQQTTKK